MSDASIFDQPAQTPNWKELYESILFDRLADIDFTRFLDHPDDNIVSLEGIAVTDDVLQVELSSSTLDLPVLRGLYIVSEMRQLSEWEKRISLVLSHDSGDASVVFQHSGKSEGFAVAPAAEQIATPARPVAPAPSCLTCDPIDDDDEDGMQMYVDAGKRWEQQKDFIKAVMSIPGRVDYGIEDDDIRTVGMVNKYLTVFVNTRLPYDIARRFARDVFALANVQPYGFGDPLEKVHFALSEEFRRGAFPFLWEFTRADVSGEDEADEQECEDSCLLLRQTFTTTIRELANCFADDAIVDVVVRPGRVTLVLGRHIFSQTMRDVATVVFKIADNTPTGFDRPLANVEFTVRGDGPDAPRHLVMVYDREEICEETSEQEDES